MTVKVGFNHIGITVSDLDVAIAFYRDLFGLPPGMLFEVKSRPEMLRMLALPEHTQRIALVPVGEALIELIEITPNRRPIVDMRQDDVGYAYLSFIVDNLDEVYEELTAKGFTFNSPPVSGPDEDPFRGSKFCILKDPDGKNLEFVQHGPELQTAAVRARAERGVGVDRPYLIG